MEPIVAAGGMPPMPIPGMLPMPMPMPMPIAPMPPMFCAPGIRLRACMRAMSCTNCPRWMPCAQRDQRRWA
eukprot:1150605-Pelagomonas_calceolata.AAC.3